jgi:ABC-type uncharacterized transport system substrate-binding protein
VSLRRAACAAALFGTVAALSAFAHPHVFINNTMTVVFGGRMLKGMTFRWVFDDMFSEMILTDFKPDGEGRFSAKKTAGIKAGAFDNLENYHYFLVFSINGKRLRKLRIEQFTPSVIDGGKLVYSFFVPLEVPVSAEEQNVRVTVYDDTYFVAFDLMHADDVTVKGDDAVSVRLSIEKSKVKPVWPGQYMPDNLVIRFKEKS